MLVKEKNRLHDTLQDMAKRHSMTSRSLAFAEKAAANVTVSPRVTLGSNVSVSGAETPTMRVEEKKSDGEVDLDEVRNCEERSDELGMRDFPSFMRLHKERSEE